MEWYPWYPALYRADTIHLTAEQDGIYRRLIDHYMETRQPLPNNDAALARIAGITIDSWTIAAVILLPFFLPSKNGKLHLKRCDAELERQDGRNRLQSEKGKSGAKKRWKNKQSEQYVNSSGYTSAIATPMPKNSIQHDTTGQDKTSSSVVRGNPDFQKIYQKGVELFPALAPKNTYEIQKWLDGGCSVQFDILPTIESVANTDVGSWNYFTKAIMNAKANREKPLPEGKSYETTKRNNGKPSWKSEGDRLRDKYTAEAERERQAAASGGITPDLRLTESLRKDS